MSTSRVAPSEVAELDSLEMHAVSHEDDLQRQQEIEAAALAENRRRLKERCDGLAAQLEQQTQTLAKVKESQENTAKQQAKIQVCSDVLCVMKGVTEGGGGCRVRVFCCERSGRTFAKKV